MSKSGEWLRERRLALKLLQSDVAKRAGVSTSYISTIERGQKHSITGAELRPEPEKVKAIAKAVQANVDEALVLFGYAPSTSAPKTPTTLPELIAALESLGIESPMMFEQLPADPNGDAYREVIARIWESFQLVIQRMIKTGKPGYIVQDITLTEIDYLEDVDIPALRKTK